MAPQLYLDHAAATPIDPAVFEAMKPHMMDHFYNPSATYLAGRSARRALEDARSDIAQSLGARPTEMILTAGGSEANNLAVRGVMGTKPTQKILVSSIEHDSVLAAAGMFSYELIPVNAHGLVDLSALAAMLDDSVAMVSVMYVNNEVGTVQPIAAIAALLAERYPDRSSRPLFHTDACQAPLYLDMHVHRLGVDMMTINGGKVYGPKQTGVLFVRVGVSLQPLIYGGGQEQGLRSGTENTAGAVGLAAALTAAQMARKSETLRLRDIQHKTIHNLTAVLPTIRINGSRKHRTPSNIHFTIPGVDNERLMMQLDERGFMVAVGSACSASSEAPSHVLMAMGLSEANAQSSIRITMGRTTTQADMDRFVAALSQLSL